MCVSHRRGKSWLDQHFSCQLCHDCERLQHDDDSTTFLTCSCTKQNSIMYLLHVFIRVYFCNSTFFGSFCLCHCHVCYDHVHKKSLIHNVTVTCVVVLHWVSLPIGRQDTSTNFKVVWRLKHPPLNHFFIQRRCPRCVSTELSLVFVAFFTADTCSAQTSTSGCTYCNSLFISDTDPPSSSSIVGPWHDDDGWEKCRDVPKM